MLFSCKDTIIKSKYKFRIQASHTKYMYQYSTFMKHIDLHKHFAHSAHCAPPNSGKDLTTHGCCCRYLAKTKTESAPVSVAASAFVDRPLMVLRPRRHGKMVLRPPGVKASARCLLCAIHYTNIISRSGCFLSSSFTNTQCENLLTVNSLFWEMQSEMCQDYVHFLNY